MLVFVISRRRVVFVTVGDATVVRRFSHTSGSSSWDSWRVFLGKQFWLYFIGRSYFVYVSSDLLWSTRVLWEALPSVITVLRVRPILITPSENSSKILSRWSSIDLDRILESPIILKRHLIFFVKNVTYHCVTDTIENQCYKNQRGLNGSSFIV